MVSRNTGWCDFRIRDVITALALILLAGGAWAVPYEKWSNTFGGKAGDEASYVQQTKDGGYIIAGYTESFSIGGRDPWLIKTDTNGIEQWNRTFGGIDREEARFVQQTKDGGYIIAGFKESSGEGGIDAWIAKSDSNGFERWNLTFGGKGYETASSVHETKDGSYIVAGSTNAYGAGGIDVWLIKIDSNGIEQWNRTFGGKRTFGKKGSDEGTYVSQTKDGGYIIAGYTESFSSGNFDAWLIKTDTNGIEQWNRTFGGKDHEYAYSVQQINDGGYIISGTSISYEAGTGYSLIIKTDGYGKELWNKTFGGRESAIARSIQQTPDGGFIAAGETSSNGEHPDAWLIKTDANGIEQWSKVFGGIRNDIANSVQLTNDGGYIFAGSRTDLYGDGYQNAWLVKVNEGAIETEKHLLAVSSSDIAKNIALKNLDNDILNRTPDIFDTSSITDKPALIILTFKDPDSPAHTIVAVDLNKNTIDSVEKKYWNSKFPLFFNITSNPSGVDVYFSKYSPELCSPSPHKLGGDFIGKTPLTYRYEYNETFLPFSGLFSLFSFNSTGYEDAFKCINIAGTESSEISVDIISEGGSAPVSRTPFMYNISAELKPLEKINNEKQIEIFNKTLRADSNETQTVIPLEKTAGFEFYMAITALLLSINRKQLLEGNK